MGDDSEVASWMGWADMGIEACVKDEGTKLVGSQVDQTTRGQSRSTRHYYRSSESSLIEEATLSATEHTPPSFLPALLFCLSMQKA